MSCATLDSPIELMDALVAATENQLRCARKLDGPGVEHHNRTRNDLLFALQIALQEPLPQETLSELRQRAIGLADLEDRLERVATAVLSTLASIRPGDDTQRYDARGRVAAG